MSYDIYEGDPMHPRVPGEMVDFTQLDDQPPHGGLMYVTEQIDRYYQGGDPDTIDAAVRTLRGMDEAIPDQFAQAMLYASFIPVIVERGEGDLADEIPLLCTDHNLDIALKRVRSTLATLDNYLGWAIPETEPWKLLKSIEYDVRGAALQIATGKLSVDRALRDVEADSEPVGLLFPSGSREKNPIYYADDHDFHTFNADDPSARKRVHVPTSERTDLQVGTNCVRYSILDAARVAFNMVYPGKVRSTAQISASDVLEIVSAKPDWNPSRIPEALQVKEIMADHLYDLLLTAEPDESLLYPPTKPDQSASEVA